MKTNPKPIDPCEKYLREEIKRVDDIPINKRIIPEFYKRNTLFCCWLLQRESLAADLESLAALVGISISQLNSILLELSDFIQEKTTRAVRLIPNMINAIEKVFNDPDLNYRILEPVPYFGKIFGYKFLEYMNNLDEPNHISFSGLVMNAFQSALLGTFTEVISDELPHIRLVVGPSRRWYFILGILPNKGPINLQGIRNLTADLWLLHGDLHSQGFDDLNILVMTSNITEEGKDFIGHRPEMHHLWGFSSLRFFHLLKSEIDKYDERGKQLISENFNVIFAQSPSSTFGIRDAFKVLGAVVEEKKRTLGE